MDNIFDISTFQAMLRLATPTLLAALGGVLAHESGVLDISLEGKMIVGAFFAIAVAQASGNVWIGVFAGGVAGAVLGLLFAFMVISVKANDVITGVAINIFADGLTSYLLRVFLGTSGTHALQGVEGQAQVNPAFLQAIPILGPILSNHTPLVYAALLFAPLLWIVFYKFPVGFRVRAVGERAIAARTAGVNVERVRYGSLLVGGFLCGLGGAFLSTGSLSMFTEGMVAGRGFMAFSAVIFGRGNPVWVLLASLLFGLSEAVGFKVQIAQIALQQQVVQMLPYLITVVFIALTSWLRSKRVGQLSAVTE
jgi:ABC-type uncharacterized transport system permease subunit